MFDAMKPRRPKRGGAAAPTPEVPQPVAEAAGHVAERLLGFPAEVLRLLGGIGLDRLRQLHQNDRLSRRHLDTVPGEQ